MSFLTSIWIFSHLTSFSNFMIFLSIQRLQVASCIIVICLYYFSFLSVFSELSKLHGRLHTWVSRCWLLSPLFNLSRVTNTFLRINHLNIFVLHFGGLLTVYIYTYTYYKTKSSATSVCLSAHDKLENYCTDFHAVFTNR